MVFDPQQLRQWLQDRDLKTPEDLQAVLGEMTTEVIQAVYEGELTAI